MNCVLIQADIKNSAAENRDSMQRLLAGALVYRPDVLVLPEMWNTGFEAAAVFAQAEAPGGRSIAMLREFARTHGVNIVGGSLAERRSGDIYNVCTVIGRDGEIVAEYSKTHLFPLTGEDRLFSPGDELAVFELDSVPCGVIICFDLRFPELSRVLAVAGAQVIFCPAQWPRARHHAWETLLAARALENQVYMVGVNRAGADGFGVYGNSRVLGPDGEVIGLVADAAEALAAVDLDLQRLARLRRDFPFLACRRPLLYHNITEQKR
jgi:predicted amidohydrolase